MNKRRSQQETPRSSRRVGFCRQVLMDSGETPGNATQVARRLIAAGVAAMLLPLGEVEVFAQQAPPPQNNAYSQSSPSAQGGYDPRYDPYYGQTDPDAQPPASAPPQQYGQPANPAYGGAAAPQQGYGPVAGQPLPAQRLEQLAAPIALYPDALVAQVLAASTYPTQVVQADRWLQVMGYASPDQIAAGADQQPWDPSVKALIAFPQVLAEMDRNLQWTTDLGNAYFNQPQDVLESIQVLRQRAQAAGNLQSTPQETVSYDQGSIALAPPNPQMVYVPYYDPWVVYGQPVAPYPGFSLLGAIGSVLSASGSFLGSGLGAGLGGSPIHFGAGILLSAFNRTPWGALAWALSWLNLSVLFNHSSYYSHSTTVADWGLPHGGWRAAAEGRSMARPGTGPYRAPANFGRATVSRPADYRSSYNQPAGRQNFAASNGAYGGNRAVDSGGRGYPNPAQGGYRQPQMAYNRAPELYAGVPYSHSPYGTGYGSGYRPAYGSAYYGGQSQSHSGRPGTPYGGAQQPYRTPATAYPQSNFGQSSSRTIASQTFAAHGGNGFAEAKAPKSNSSHLFGGGHEAKAFGGGKSFGSKHSGGGGHFGGHIGSKHRL